MPATPYEWACVLSIILGGIAIYRACFKRAPKVRIHQEAGEDKVPNHWWYWDRLPHSDPRRRYHDDRRREEKERDEKERQGEAEEERRRYGK